MRATRRTPPLRGSPTVRRGARPGDRSSTTTPLIPRTPGSRFPARGPAPDATAPVTRPAAAGPTFYRQPGICVTADWFVVAGRRFAIRDLTELRTARGARDRLTGRLVAVTVVILSAIAVTIGFTQGLAEVSAAAYFAMLVAAFVPVGLGWLGDKVRPRSYELWGRHEGLLVLLFSTDEERQYGQVSRALMRAREMSRLAGLSEPVTIEPWVPDQR